MAGIRAAGDGVVFTGIEGVRNETSRAGIGVACFPPKKGAVWLDGETSKASDIPSIAVVCFYVKWCAEICTANGESERVSLWLA